MYSEDYLAEAQARQAAKRENMDTAEIAQKGLVEPRKEVGPRDLSKKKLETVREAFTRVYGNPHVQDAFPMVAHMWAGYKGIQFTPFDVAFMLTLWRIAEVKQGPLKDSLPMVGIIGYALLANELLPGEK